MTSRLPRRAYVDGKMLEPPTVGQSRARGETTAALFCEAVDCRHNAIISTDRFPDDLPFPDIADHMFCSRCKGRNVKVQLDVGAMYERNAAERQRQNGPMVKWPEERKDSI